ncbi:MAG: LPS export ABC transporter permease LptG [Oceanococcaceae bacterium]
MSLKPSILDRHLGGALLGAALLTAVVLLGLSGFVSFVEELDGAERHGLGLAEVGWLTVLKLPELLFEMFPLIVLLGAILGLGGLAAGGELVVMQAAGMPVWRIAWSAAMAGLLLGLLSLLIGDRLVPWARAQATSVRVGSVEMTRGDLWLREGSRYVSVGQVPAAESLRSLRIFELDDAGSSLQAMETAELAEFGPDGWQAQDWTRELPLEDALQLERRATTPLALDFGPDVLRLFLLRADSLSIPGLQRYIRYLEANKLDSHRPRMEFWRKLATPLSVVAMVLIAVPFVLGPLRDTGAGQRLFVGVLLGIAFYVFNETVINLGSVYRWSPPLAALTPAICLGLIATFRLARHRAR